jgi:hypothetical protein
VRRSSEPWELSKQKDVTKESGGRRSETYTPERERKEVMGDGRVPIRDGIRGRGRGAHRPGSRAYASEDGTQRRARVAVASLSPRRALGQSSMRGCGYACGKEVNLGRVIEPQTGP